MSGGFHEVLMDSSISYGALGGPRVSTTITSTKSGYRKVNRNWTEIKSRWDLAYGLKEYDDVRTLRSFYVSRYGPLFGFRFWDRLNYQASGVNLGWGDGATKEIQLRKLYYGSWTITADITTTVPDGVNTFSAAEGTFRDILADMKILVSGAGEKSANGLWAVDTVVFSDSDPDVITLSATDIGGTPQVVTPEGPTSITLTLAVEEKTIKKPVAGNFTPDSTTLIIKEDGISKTFSIDETTGLATMDAAPGANDVMSWDGEYHIPVAFEKDELDISLDAYEAGTLQDIMIEELLL